MRVAPILLGLLLLLPMFSLSAAAQETEKYAEKDGTADVTVNTVSGATAAQPPPGAPHVNEVDLVELAIDDPSVETLELRLKTVAPFVAGSSAFVNSGSESVAHQIAFTAPRSQQQIMVLVTSNAGNGANLIVAAAPNTPFKIARISICTVMPSYGGASCMFGGLQLEYRVEEGVLVIPIPKPMLLRGGPLGRMPGGAQLPELIEPGDLLVKPKVVGVYNPPMSFQSGPDSQSRTLGYVDLLPNTGAAKDYAFKHGVSVPDLKLAAGRAGVIAGEQTAVPVLVQNLAQNKRLINLTADVVESLGKGAWKLSITPTMTLAGEKAGNATLRVVAPTTDSFDQARIRVTARILNEPGRVAVLDTLLHSGPPLDAKNNKFFLHSLYGGNYFVEGAGDTELTAGFLNRYETDPTSSDPRGVTASRSGIGVIGISTYSVYFTADIQTGHTFHDAMPNRAAVVAGAGKIHLDLDAPLPLETEATIHLSAQSISGERLLIQEKKPVSLKQGRNEVEFDVTNLAPGHVIGGEATNLRLRVELRSTAPETILHTFASFAKNMRLYPKTTWFTLPLSREAEFIPDENLPKVTLAPAEDREAFANPGRQIVFHLDVANLEPTVQRVEVVVDNASKPWSTAVLPAPRLRLNGNESARVGVVVRLPDDAAEGDTNKFNVQVRLTETGARLAEVPLLIIATRGLTIDNETFEGATEDASKLDVDAKKSPGPMPVLLILGLAALAAVRRRRIA